MIRDRVGPEELLLFFLKVIEQKDVSRPRRSGVYLLRGSEGCGPGQQSKGLYQGPLRLKSIEENLSRPDCRVIGQLNALVRM